MKNILILGGGTAGWMTANALQHAFKDQGVLITLVESPQIGTIGVGEGSTPHLKRFFDHININEQEWMPACSATYKNGISFIDWTEHLPQNSYFHPFPSIIDRQTAGAFLTNCMARHHGHAVDVNPEHYFLAKTLSANAYGPLTLSDKAITPMNYAYHFDSKLLGDFLAKKGVEAGVKHIQGKFVKAYSDTMGNICHIELEDKRQLQADFFIDASGFASYLLQQHCDVKFESFTSSLFNDSAIALPSETASPILAETKATALKYGWAWHIPLTNRTGNGYVFSSQYTNFEDAEMELRTHLHDTHNKVNENTPARRIKMKVGQAKQAWCNNVLALGLAQGFIEPLEATALHMVIDSIDLFIQKFKQGAYQNEDRDLFNKAISERYLGIKDYIVCHYKVNQKSNSDYWNDCRNMNNISDNLQTLIEAWCNKKEITPVLDKLGMTTYYPAISWYCLLAGYGYFNHSPVNYTSMSSARVKANQQAMERMQHFLKQQSTKFSLHQALLNRK